MASTSTSETATEEAQRAPFFDDEQLADEIAHELPDDDDSHPTLVEWQVDQAALAAAHGDPLVWAREFGALIAAVTHKHLSEETIVGWFAGFGRQIESRTYREAMFQVANTSLPPHPQGDSAFLLLQLRDEIARGFRAVASG